MKIEKDKKPIKEVVVIEPADLTQGLPLVRTGSDGSDALRGSSDSNKDLRWETK